MNATATDISALVRQTPWHVIQFTQTCDDAGTLLKIIDEAKDQYWPFADIVAKLYERLGMHDEAKAYALTAATDLAEHAINVFRRGVATHVSNMFLASLLYTHFGMHKSAFDVLNGSGGFDEALRYAQEHLEGEEQRDAYKSVLDAATERPSGYHKGFPVRIKALELLDEKELLLTEKRNYLTYLLDKGAFAHSITLAKEVGTEKQLRRAHDLMLSYNINKNPNRPKGRGIFNVNIPLHNINGYL